MKRQIITTIIAIAAVCSSWAQDHMRKIRTVDLGDSLNRNLPSSTAKLLAQHIKIGTPSSGERVYF